MRAIFGLWPGPSGYLVHGALAIAIVLLLSFPGNTAESAMQTFDPSARWWQPVSSEEAWEYLPVAVVGQGQTLPNWARLLAPRLPRTTAALLRLDYVQRAESPIPAGLRAALRYTIATAHGCDYARVAAAHDARMVGIDDSMWQALDTPEMTGWSPAEQRALRFARDMTLSSSSIPDANFQELVYDFGERIAACMVLLSAYSNMQDRLLLSLDVDASEDLQAGTLAPLNVEFDYKVAGPRTPIVEAGQLQPSLTAGVVPDTDHRIDPQWNQLTFEELQGRLAKQRERATRLPIPEWKEFAHHLPAELFPESSDIVWYRIALGYAHELALPFERVMRFSGSETQSYYDRVFGTSLFWIVTKAMECPYCMGHCEMNWEVAGLSQAQIQQRSRQLSDGQWMGFSAIERSAFAFARKLSQDPSTISDADVLQLRQEFGDTLALAIAVQVSRYHYMVRISNGFQLQLEKENVFFDYWKKTRAAEASAAAFRGNENPSSQRYASDEATWKLLPAVRTGERGPLPNFIKAVAKQLPRTAAAMLELDAAHRLNSPVPPRLRAKLRWVIASANRSGYSQETALADLRRTGADEGEVEQLVGNPGDWPISEAGALQLIRDLTLNASAVTDNDFESVRQQYGDRMTAAIVMLAAYGNFQDRILLGLQVPLESDGPLAPLDVRFEAGALQRAPVMPELLGEDVYLDVPKSYASKDPLWSSVTYDQLQQRLESQRQREPRLPIPTWEQVKLGLPEEMSQSPTSIRWSLINYGYVPELAIPWTTATRTHWSEAPSERILEESLFWVQTRAINCNYCMGHCEMLLQVAGLSDGEVAHRTRLLAETDWSAFPPKEQRAYAYARKLTQRPWTLTAEDYRLLEEDFGPRQAMSVFWWLCRGLYMTRISDGFQLPLEEQNVFADHRK